jgi:hypothetical protein
MQPKRRSLVMPVSVRLVAGAAVFLVAIVVSAAVVSLGADLYDEGFIANGAALALRGEWPGASYYAPYPPGAFAALALAFRLWGVRLVVERWFAAFMAALVAAMGYWLVSGFECESRLAYRRDSAAMWFAALAAALLLAVRWVTPVNGGALALALAAGLGLRGALPRGRPAAGFCCGALIGAAALCRLDFGLYATAAAMPVWLLFAGHRDGLTLTRSDRWRGALAIGVGALAVMGPPLGWILAHGGQRAADSLFWWPLTSTGAQRLPRTRYWGAFLTAAVSLLLCARAVPALRRDPSRFAMASWLILLGLGFLTYSLGRTHATHLLPLRIVSLLLAGLSVGTGLAADGRQSPDARIERTQATPIAALLTNWHLPIPAPWACAALGAIIVSTVVGPIREYVHARRLTADRRAALPGPRGAGIFPPPREVRDYDRILSYLSQEVRPEARVYFGTSRHDIFLKDDNLAYFLSGRESGTYYWCLDAAVTSTEPVQSEMVRELEANHVDVALIRTASVNHEPNTSSRSSGVHLLDDYLHGHFRLAAAWDDYQIFRRTH